LTLYRQLLLTLQDEALLLLQLSLTLLFQTEPPLCQAFLLLRPAPFLLTLTPALAVTLLRASITLLRVCQSARPQ
jgi:hypothetical protein